MQKQERSGEISITDYVVVNVFSKLFIILCIYFCFSLLLFWG